MRADIEEVIQHALEASLYFRPREPGLAAEEIREVAMRAGFGHGQINDHLNTLSQGPAGRFMPEDPFSWDANFPALYLPDYRNPKAFELVRQHLRHLAAEHGRAKARATREALLALGKAASVSELDIDIAIQLLAMDGVVRLEGDTVIHTEKNEVLVMPQAQNGGPSLYERPRLKEAYDLVRSLLAPTPEDRTATTRRELLMALYAKYMDSPTAQLGWRRDTSDPNSSLRIREAEWLNYHGLILATFGASGDFMAKLTVKGRQFVESESGFGPVASLAQTPSISGKPVSVRESAAENHDRRNMTDQVPDPKKVFIIHGRNTKARKAVEQFVRALGLVPIDFEQLAADSGAAFVGEIVRTGLAQAQGIIALFTADEISHLRPDYHEPHDGQEDKMRWQSRPNVIFEAGMAYGSAPERTILAVLGGQTKLFSDVKGLHLTYLSNSHDSRKRLRQKLIGAKCEVDLRSDAYDDPAVAGDFDACVLPEVSTRDPFRV